MSRVLDRINTWTKLMYFIQCCAWEFLKWPIFECIRVSSLPFQEIKSKQSAKRALFFHGCLQWYSFPSLVVKWKWCVNCHSSCDDECYQTNVTWCGRPQQSTCFEFHIIEFAGEYHRCTVLRLSDASVSAFISPIENHRANGTFQIRTEHEISTSYHYIKPDDLP